MNLPAGGSGGADRPAITAPPAPPKRHLAAACLLLSPRLPGAKHRRAERRRGGGTEVTPTQTCVPPHLLVPVPSGLVGTGERWWWWWWWGGGWRLLDCWMLLLNWGLITRLPPRPISKQTSGNWLLRPESVHQSTKQHQPAPLKWLQSLVAGCFLTPGFSYPRAAANSSSSWLND